MALDYSLMWKVLRGRPSLAALEARLSRLPLEQLRGAAAAFIDARTELVDAFEQQGVDASEDIRDDLAGALIREGPRAYEEYQAGTRALPAQGTWGGLESSSASGPFFAVVRKRLRTSAYELWEQAIR